MLEDFFVPPDRDLQRENDLKPQEILTAISLPPSAEAARMAHMRQGEKNSFDWPLADVAVVLDLSRKGVQERDDHPRRRRARATSRKSRRRRSHGKRIDEVAREAGRAALDGATPLTKNAYKLPLFESLVQRTILKAVAVT